MLVILSRYSGTWSGSSVWSAMVLMVKVETMAEYSAGGCAVGPQPQPPLTNDTTTIRARIRAKSERRAKVGRRRMDVIVTSDRVIGTETWFMPQPVSMQTFP